MKKMFISVFLITFMLTTSNALAQAPSYKPYSWTGFYFGVQGSYQTGKSEWGTEYGGSRFNHDIDGGMGGIFIGYNYHTASRFVIGVETEMNFGRVDGSSSCPNTNYSCHTDVNWIGSTRGRFGFAIDRFMPYVSIGWTYGVANTYVRYLPTGGEYGSRNGYLGFVPGIGFEVAITKNLIARAEYNYYYFFSTKVDIDYSSTDVQFDTSAFKLGLSFKF